MAVLTVGILIGLGVASWRRFDVPAIFASGGPAVQPKKGPPKAKAGVKTYKGQFDGIVNRTVQDSVPSWPVPVRAKPGSPNVIFIVLDDVGFGQLGCFGGQCKTPNLDRLAKNGLRYNNMHTTALCSPTRSSILTGRNHHKNNMACITELSTGFPGYNGRIPFENGFISEILQRFGYATFVVGKWHLTPDEEMNMGATKVRWPLGRGFERFYGFLGGDTHQYYPDLVSDNTPVSPPKTPEQGYHLTDDITEKSIGYIRDLRAVTPDKPFFLYYAPGAMHAPHHVPKEWIARHKGKFNMGWDKAREIILANQIKLGVVPEGTKLPPRNEEVKAWDKCTAKEKQLYSYMMEIFAGFLEHTDDRIGRLITYLEETKQLDNTLIMVISDNGASAEGGPNGVLCEGSFFNGVQETVDFIWKNKDRLGTPNSFNHYPFGWTMAGCTPFKKWKRETHLGGIRDPFIVHWPKGIKEKNAIRSQYAHAIDLVPTVLDVCGITPPKAIGGITQSAFDGVSFKHTFNDAKAKSKRPTQYYEMFGYRAIYHDGWTAVSPHLPFGTPIDEKVLAKSKWELYNTDQDFSQFEDLAAKFPARVKMMEEIWWAEAAKNNVLPLDGRSTLRMIEPRPQITPGRSSYEYFPGGAPVSHTVAAPTINRSFKITAEIDTGAKGAEGVIIAHGGNFGGWSLYAKDGKLHYAYNWLGIEHYDLVSSVDLPRGKSTVGLQFMKTGKAKFGAGGVAILSINGKSVATKVLPKTVPTIYWPHNEGLTCGYDDLTPVTSAYQSPFRFTGVIHRAVVTVNGPAGPMPKRKVPQ
ncbi:MAG: arylsulfatase [Planctomycetes bacterium]|nr:arylsulfatase [Planctomycetota bacterium]